MGYVHGGVAHVEWHRLVYGVVLRTLQLVMILLEFAQLFIMVVLLDVFILLDDVGINLVPFYHQFEG